MTKSIPVLLIGGKSDGTRTVAQSSPIIVQEYELPRFSEDFNADQPCVKVEAYDIYNLGTSFVGVYRGLTRDEAVARLISRYPKKRKPRQQSWKRPSKLSAP